MKNEHEVIVYDYLDNELYRCFEHKNITKMVRWEHNINGEIVYSHNYYYDNGMILFGMVPSPPFRLKSK
jgi:hypothetical protein